MMTSASTHFLMTSAQYVMKSTLFDDISTICNESYTLFDDISTICNESYSFEFSHSFVLYSFDDVHNKCVHMYITV